MTSQDEYTVLEMDRNRRAVARSMRASASEIPHVTLHRKANAEPLLAARTQMLADTAPGDERVTVTVLLARIVARALRAYPRINGRSEEGEIRLYQRVNLGLAVALDDGLTVPVLHDADRASLQELAARITNVSRRARAGALKVADLVDGTFSLSNLGSHGVEFFTPLINPPQIAILGVGATTEEVRMRDGAPVVERHLRLSLSFDHAAIDGAPAAGFLDLVVSNIEEPHAFLAEESVTSAGDA